MDISKIAVGKTAPEEINVIVEVSKGAGPVKYEMDKDSGALFVDRFIQTSMHYPCNYGFIPHTLSDDGDPADVLIVSDLQVMPGAVVACRPIGVLLMEDESGGDEKILAVPTDKLDPFYKDIKTHTDLPEVLLDRIKNFFENYKALEKGKWVKIEGWAGKDKAVELIKAAIENAK
jgi:inorganic pyrophosphatase